MCIKRWVESTTENNLLYATMIHDHPLLAADVGEYWCYSKEDGEMLFTWNGTQYPDYRVNIYYYLVPFMPDIKNVTGTNW